MSFISRQVKPPARLTITCKLPEETVILLRRYAEFLDSTQEHIVNETLCLVFRRDTAFKHWLVATCPGAPAEASDPPASAPRVERARS